jgi:hypothetical protein
MILRTLSLALLGCSILFAAAPKEVTDTFHKNLTQEGISFQIQETHENTHNIVTITPKGLTESNRAESTDIDGTIVDAKIADINHDGAPEVYVFITSEGSGSYGSLVAYTTNHNKSMSMIYLPELDPQSKEAQGYMGHDTFTLTKDRLVRRFPVYKKGDPNCCPSGGIRELSYTLVPGEAMWQLKLVESKTTKQVSK